MKKTVNVRTLTQFALLTALELLMAFTPIGYLQLGPLSATLITVPVAIGAMVVGPACGAWMGLVFGMTSFYKMLTAPSAFGTVMMAASPALSFVNAVVARVLCGLCCGLIFAGLRKVLPKRPEVCATVGALSAPLLNTFFYMGCIVLFFYNTSYVQNFVGERGITNPIAFVVAFVGVQALIEAGVCMVIGSAVTIPLLKYLKKA